MTLTFRIESLCFWVLVGFLWVGLLTVGLKMEVLVTTGMGKGDNYIYGKVERARS